MQNETSPLDCLDVASKKSRIGGRGGGFTKSLLTVAPLFFSVSLQIPKCEFGTSVGIMLFASATLMCLRSEYRRKLKRNASAGSFVYQCARNRSLCVTWTTTIYVT